MSKYTKRLMIDLLISSVSAALLFDLFLNVVRRTVSIADSGRTGITSAHTGSRSIATADRFGWFRVGRSLHWIRSRIDDRTGSRPSRLVVVDGYRSSGRPRVGPRIAGDRPRRSRSGPRVETDRISQSGQ